MSYNVVVSSIPFSTRLAHGAKNILARDQARAQKLLKGVHPIGPLAFQESRRARELHRGRHHHHKEQVPTTTQPSKGGSAPSGDSSIDVTDAGLFV